MQSSFMYSQHRKQRIIADHSSADKRVREGEGMQDEEGIPDEEDGGLVFAWKREVFSAVTLTNDHKKTLEG
jgi:hypothetical protein